MLKIFENIRPVSAIYILVFGLLLRVPSLILGPQGEEITFDPAILRGFFNLVNKNYAVSVLVGLFVIFIQSIWFNRLCIDHDVIYTHSYLPGYFFMLANSLFPESLVVNPVMLMNFSVIASFTYLFRLHHSINSAGNIYYASLFMGLASLIMPLFYSGTVFLVVAIMAFKNINLKDLLAILTGYIFAGMIAAGSYYIAGTQYHFPRIDYQLNLQFGRAEESWAVLSIAMILGAAGLAKTFINYSKNNIKTRRIALLMSAYLAFAVFLILFNSSQYILLFPLLAPCLGVLMAYFLIGKRQRRGKEFLHYILLLAILWSLYSKSLNLF